MTALGIHHYRIDQQHSNAYTLWKQMGSPPQPTPEQYTQLEAAGQLELLTSPRYIDTANGNATLEFALPRQGVSLVQLVLGAKVTSAQVALCLIDLKLARLVGDPKHLDSIVDVAGYAACLREVTHEI